jgi:Effector-associated domain 10
MSLPDELSTILDRIITNQQHTKADRDRLRELLDGSRQLVQSGKYAIVPSCFSAMMCSISKAKSETVWGNRQYSHCSLARSVTSRRRAADT